MGIRRNINLMKKILKISLYPIGFVFMMIGVGLFFIGAGLIHAFEWIFDP